MCVSILQRGDYPGWSRWALNAIILSLIRGRQREMKNTDGELRRMQTEAGQCGRRPGHARCQQKLEDVRGAHEKQAVRKEEVGSGHSGGCQ